MLQIPTSHRHDTPHQVSFCLPTSPRPTLPTPSPRPSTMPPQPPPHLPGRRSRRSSTPSTTLPRVWPPPWCSAASSSSSACWWCTRPSWSRCGGSARPGSTTRPRTTGWRGPSWAATNTRIREAIRHVHCVLDRRLVHSHRQAKLTFNLSAVAWGNW